MSIRGIRFMLVCVVLLLGGSVGVLEFAVRRGGLVPRPQPVNITEPVPYYTAVKEGELRFRYVLDAASAESDSPAPGAEQAPFGSSSPPR